MSQGPFSPPRESCDQEGPPPLISQPPGEPPAEPPAEAPAEAPEEDGEAEEDQPIEPELDESHESDWEIDSNSHASNETCVAGPSGVHNQASNGMVMGPTQISQQDLWMEGCQLKFWQAEQEIRTRTQGLTAWETEQLLNLPFCTDERVKSLGKFGTKEPHSVLVEWAKDLIPHLDPKWRAPGQCLHVTHPVWTLCKGIYTAELEMDRIAPGFEGFGCHCLNATCFMVHGCKCDESRVWHMGVFPSILCRKCSLCLRCMK